MVKKLLSGTKIIKSNSLFKNLLFKLGAFSTNIRIHSISVPIHNSLYSSDNWLSHNTAILCSRLS